MIKYRVLFKQEERERGESWSWVYEPEVVFGLWLIIIILFCLLSEC